MNKKVCEMRDHKKIMSGKEEDLCKAYIVYSIFPVSQTLFCILLFSCSLDILLWNKKF